MHAKFIFSLLLQNSKWLNCGHFDNILLMLFTFPSNDILSCRVHIFLHDNNLDSFIELLLIHLMYHIFKNVDNNNQNESKKKKIYPIFVGFFFNLIAT